MTNYTDTPDPLGDIFEDMGIKVVDCTPKGQSVTETPNTLPTDTDDQSEIWSVIDRYVDAGHISDDGITAIQDAITQYTTKRERALLDELEKIVNRRWGEITTDTGDKAVLRDHLNHFIKSKRGLQNQTNKENTHDQL